MSKTNCNKCGIVFACKSCSEYFEAVDRDAENCEFSETCEVEEDEDIV